MTDSRELREPTPPLQLIKEGSDSRFLEYLFYAGAAFILVMIGYAIGSAYYLNQLAKSFE